MFQRSLETGDNSPNQQPSILSSKENNLVSTMLQQQHEETGSLCQESLN